MRILQVHPFLKGDRINPHAGEEARMSLSLTRCLLELGHDVAIFPWGERIWGAPIRFGVTSVHFATVFPTMTFPSRRTAFPDWRKVRGTRWPEARERSVLADLFLLAGLRSAVTRYKPAVLHLHIDARNFPAMYRLAGLHTPLVLTQYSNRTDFDPHSFSQILFASNTMREEICGSLGYPLERARVIRPPEETSRERFGKETLKVYEEVRLRK
jgi:hypothetical protein